MSIETLERIATRAIIKIDNQVLLGKRGRGIGVGQYAFIEGKPDLDETSEQAVRRETREEIGAELKNLVFWKDEINDKTIPSQKWRTHYFIGEIEGELALKQDEVAEIVYVNRRNLKDLDIAFNHREILEEFFGLR